MSRAYRLTSGAESDVQKILEYTLERWGSKQAANYASLLEDAIEKLAARELAGRKFSTNLPDVRVHRCEHHYIFFLPGDHSLLVLAILHESMDLMTHLRERLGE